ncbi:MAG TPA: cytochrome c-type biogenesis protein [Burkholderiaceae bacterium]|nr:cytochrome c-type biogenesis protein [Burkholderiaceae bacterium]
MSTKEDPALEARVNALAEQLRCLVCQNQTIADSNAPLALDLRQQVREQLVAGRSEREILDYMSARYGDFVRYKPPLQGNTALLWGGPALLGALGIALAWRAVARRAKVARAAHDEAVPSAAPPDWLDAPPPPPDRG